MCITSMSVLAHLMPETWRCGARQGATWSQWDRQYCGGTSRGWGVSQVTGALTGILVRAALAGVLGDTWLWVTVREFPVLAATDQMAPTWQVRPDACS